MVCPCFNTSRTTGFFDLYSVWTSWCCTLESPSFLSWDWATSCSQQGWNTLFCKPLSIPQTYLPDAITKAGQGKLLLMLSLAPPYQKKLLRAKGGGGLDIYPILHMKFRVACLLPFPALAVRLVGLKDLWENRSWGNISGITVTGPWLPSCYLWKSRKSKPFLHISIHCS